jgi:hypothetical protein
MERTMNNTTVTIEHADHIYTVEVEADGAIDITVDGVVAGRGTWDGRRIECDAVLPEEAYDAMEAALERADKRAR